jgi:predicted hydrocarbon binding protein
MRRMIEKALTTAAVRAALVGGSLASGSLFWARAALGENQLRMHDCTPEGEISIGGVSEQLYGEGFLAAWHEVLSRELGAYAPAALYEVGLKGARWEVRRAIDRQVWVPKLLRPLIGKREILDAARRSPFQKALLEESLHILFRMIMTEGGWGIVERIDVTRNPILIKVRNAPEPRRLGKTGRASCHLFAGIYAGYLETLFGTPTVAVETTCACKGDPLCTFEVTLIDAPAKDATRAEERRPEGAGAR